MYKLNNILVCLDLSDMDNFLIRYSDFIVNKLNAEKITFMHVVNSYDILDDVRDSFPHLDEPLTKIIEEELNEKVQESFNNSNSIETKVEIKEGYTTETILKYTQDNNINLTLMGKKLGYKGQGSVVRKVINLTSSSVLLVSETSPHSINDILVKVDFTKISEMAMNTALEIQSHTNSSISCHHVHRIPLKYFPQFTDENDKELKKHVEKHSKKEFAKFAKKLKIDKEEYNLTYSIDIENQEAHQLYNQALIVGADLIVLGSKIKSDLANIISDSTSEKLASAEKNIAVLVVKDKKYTQGFLDKLFD